MLPQTSESNDPHYFETHLFRGHITFLRLLLVHSGNKGLYQKLVELCSFLQNNTEIRKNSFVSV